MADIDVLGVSAHLDFNDIQKSIDQLINGLDKIGIKTDVLSKRMNDAMNEIARSSDDTATKNKKAMDVFAQGISEAKLALEKYPETLRQAKNEEEATALATARLEEQLKKLNAEFLNSNVGSEKYEKLKTSIAGVEQQINANNLVHEKQLQTIQEMEAGYSQLVSMYGVGSAAIGTNAIAHTTVAVATGTEAAAHLDNAEKIEKETEATKENTKEKKQLTAAQKEAIAALQPFQREIAGINQELTKDGDIQKAIQRYDELIAKIQELYNAENAKTTNFIGEHGERRDEWNEYITSADYTEAQQKALLYSNTLNELRSAKAKLASISEEVSVAQKEENQSTQIASSSFKEQWNNVNELHDKIQSLTKELRDYESEYEKLSEKPGFDPQSKKAQELTEKINNLKKEISDTKKEMSEESGVGSFLAKWKNIVVDAATGNGKFQESLGNMKNALGGLVAPFTAATTGAMNFVKSLWAMAATPIGAVISVIVLGFKAIHTWMTKSAEGQRVYTKITAYLGSLLSSLTDIAVKIGKYLYHAFADPQGALNQFGKGLVGLVINPLKTLAKTLSGVGKIAGGVIEAITSRSPKTWAEALDKMKAGWEDLKKAGSSAIDTFKSAWDTVAGAAKGAVKLIGEGISQGWTSDLGAIGSDMLGRAQKAAQLAEQELNAQKAISEAKVREKELDIEIAREREKIYTLTGKAKDEQIELVKNKLKEKYDGQIAAQKELLRITKERNNLHTKSLESFAKEREAQGAVYTLEAQRAASTRMLVRMQQANLKSMANADKKDARKEQQIEDAETNYNEIMRKNALAYAKAVQDMEQKIADARIEAMEEGSEKFLAAKERELEKELHQLDEQRKAAVEAERARQKAEFQAQEKIIKARGGKTEQWDDSKMDNTPVEAINAKFETLRKLYIERRNASEEKANKEAIKQYLSQYGEYEDKKRIIYEQANDKICEIEETLSNATTEEAKKAAEQHIEIVRKQTKEQIREIDVQYGKAKKFMVDLFEDTEQKSVGQLQKIIDKYKELLKFLKGDSSTSRDTLKALGFTDEQIDEALKNAKTRGVEFFKTISDSIKSLESDVGQKSLWQRISEKIKKARETFDSDKSSPEDKGQAMIDLSDAVLEAIPAFEDLGTAIFNCFNIDDSQLEAATQSLANFIGLAKSIGQIKAGDTMNGVMGIVGFALSSASSIINSLRSEKQLDIARATASIDRRLEVTNERLQKLNDTLKESYGVAAQDVAKETRETIETRRQLALEGLKKSNFAKNQWNDVGFPSDFLAQKIAYRYGLDIGKEHNMFNRKAEDFLDLLNYNSLDRLAAVFKQIKEEGGELWAMLTADSSVKQYVETLIDSIEELEELEKSLKEQIVGTSFDNVFNSFMSNMYNMADGAKDVEKQIASDWQQMINKMVLNNVMGEKYKEKLKAWYEKWYEAYNGDKSISESEIADLRKEYNDIVKEAADEVKALREQGIVKQTNGNDQQSTYNSLEKWSYEQADDLINRATALQIIDENQYQVLSQSLEVAYSTLSGVEGIRASVQEIASAIAVTIELQEAANGKLDKIIANTNPIGEIRDLVKKLYNER